MQKGNDFKALQILHKALLTGMFFFSIISVVIIVMGKTTSIDSHTSKILQVIVLLFSFASITAGFFLFNKRMLSINTMATAAERISIYRAAAIIRWVMIEAPVLFSIISFLLTGNYAFPGLAVALMIVFATTAPSKNKIIQQLQLNEKEVQQLEGSE